jgi:hypothetical protein
MNNVTFTKPAFVPFIRPASISVSAVSLKIAAATALGLTAAFAFYQAYQEILIYKKLDTLTHSDRLLPKFKDHYDAQRKQHLLKAIGWGVLGVAAVAMAVAAVVLFPAP